MTSTEIPIMPPLLPLYSRDYLREHELYDVVLPEAYIPDDIQDCRQVAQVVIPNSILEIYYNDVLKAPFIQFHEEWLYFGNADTTFRELLTHFGITDPIITWIEPTYAIDDIYIDAVISLSPLIIFEMDEDYNGQHGEDDNY